MNYARNMRKLGSQYPQPYPAICCLQSLNNKIDPRDYSKFKGNMKFRSKSMKETKRKIQY